MSEIKELRKSERNGTIVGTIDELNMELSKEPKFRMNDKDFTEVTVKGKKVKVEAYTRPNFKAGNFTVSVKGKPIEIYLNGGFDVTNVTKDFNSEDIIMNPMFKAVETMLQNYIKKETRVCVTARMDVNEYATDEEKFPCNPQVTGFQVTSNLSKVENPEEDIADFKIEGVVKEIMHEVKDEEETGRLKVTYLFVNNKGEVKPLELYVEKDLADAFEEKFELGKTASLGVELLPKTIGGNTQNIETSFGRRKSNIVSGYTIVELNVFNGDVYDEENINSYDIELIQKGLKEREIMIENKIKEKKEKSTGQKPQGLKSSSSGSDPFGSKGSDKKASPFG